MCVISVLGAARIQLVWTVAVLLVVFGPRLMRLTETAAGREGVGGTDVEHQAGDEGCGQTDG